MTKEEILNLIWERPVEIAYWLGLKDMTDLHNDWLRSFLYEDNDQTLQAHRGSFKSTTLALFFALHTLIKPNETIIYMRKTDDAVSKTCGDAQRYLQSGCFQKMAQVLYEKPLILTKATTSAIDTNLRTALSGQSQIIGFGLNASITGQHADIIVTDDIVTEKDRISHAERERTKLIYQELQNICNRNGRFINCGTPWHKDDAFTLMEQAGEIQKYDCYTTGLMTPEQIKRTRDKMTASLFAANYELKHIANEDAMFKEATWLDADKTNLIYGAKAHLDAAYDGSDYTAYTLLKKQGERFIGYGKIWRKHVDDVRPEILKLHKQFYGGSISVETNGDKGYLAKELRNDGMNVNKYHEHENKFIKISTYLKKYWNNIYWVAETDPDYINQILDYTEDATHDDAPDSAASLLRSFDRDITANTGAFLRGGL